MTLMPSSAGPLRSPLWRGMGQGHGSGDASAAERGPTARAIAIRELRVSSFMAALLLQGDAEDHRRRLSVVVRIIWCGHASSALFAKNAQSQGAAGFGPSATIPRTGQSRQKKNTDP